MTGETRTTIPTLYFPREHGAIAPMVAPEPVPFVMTEDELIRFLRLNDTGIKEPSRTLERYRREGWLKATQVGTRLRYQLPDVLKFLETAKEENPR